jgi:ubiquinone/menaquinone biosynthesis C-methylase UbiE
MSTYNRLYKDLAWLWPLWGSVEEYKQESEQAVELIRKHARIDVHNILDITCGGGKNACNLKQHLEVHGLDVSAAMLDNARKLNPECTFYQADMRNFDLGRQFDSIYINDGITYITSADDLLKTFTCARKHLRGGGAMICYAEYLKGTFEQNKTQTTLSKHNGVEITFIENNYDPDPNDDTFEATMVYLIREKGVLKIEHDLHICGIFTLDVWRDTLMKAGFDITEYPPDKKAFDCPTFVCI